MAADKLNVVKPSVNDGRSFVGGERPAIDYITSVQSQREEVPAAG